MLYLITGGSGSGKSEFAEKLSVDLRQQHSGGLTYVATMYPYEDEETKARITRHRSQRAGKEFETVELPLCIEKLSDALLLNNSVVLLECMSNLLANEMFADEGRMKYEGNIDKMNSLAEKYILTPCIEVAERVGDMVIVTNEIFSDVREYDEQTGEYIRLLGYINTRLAGLSDVVTEVVCGIPVSHAACATR